ncbi:unnamed protein product [Gongylonema pulchrum]|uniref:FerI domain-containing protein n=1 Tax=Gongylonema pulchrum TaxID=637853 RepID=A0A183DBX4_9BILA|nr:unnamed protein product [Gongylonema pulchrum]
MSRTSLEFQVYNARRFASDTLIGGFQCDLGFIYKAKQHMLREKWLVLRADYQEAAASGEIDRLASSDIRGFLKVSVNVRRSLDPAPAPSLRSTKKREDEDILFSGSLMQYTMLVIFQLTDGGLLIGYSRRLLLTAPNVVSWLLEKEKNKVEKIK